MNTVEYLEYPDRGTTSRPAAPWTRARVHERVITAIQATANELEIDIRVRHSAGTSVPLKLEEDQDFNGLILYDFATKALVTRAQSLEVVYIRERPDDENSPVSHFYAERNPRILNLGPEDTETEIVKSLVTGNYTPTQLGLVSLGMVWAATPLSNLSNADHWKCTFAPALKKSLDTDYWWEKAKKAEKEMEKEFLKNYKHNLDQEIISLRNSAVSCEQEIGVLGEQIVSQYRNMGSYNTRIEMFEKQKENDSNILKEQLTELKKNKYVTKILWLEQDKALEIYTIPLYLYSPNKKERALLGEMKVRVGTNGNIMIFNTTRARGARPHPHVNESGNPCWGSAQIQISKLASQTELVGLFEMTVTYMEQYNPRDSSASFLSYWFTEEDTEFLQANKKWLTKEQIKKGEVSGETTSIQTHATEVAANEIGA